MKQIEDLIERILQRTNINLREPGFDVRPFCRNLIPSEKFAKFYAFYGLTPHHPLHFRFSHSSLAGSYFLGKCFVEHSVLYKSDIRGDELKSKGDLFQIENLRIPLHDDEVIHIKDSFLVKTLVHNHSHDPENLEEFLIQNTVAARYANIHGSTVEGCFLGPFSTVDLTTSHDSVIGAFAYVQVGEMSHLRVDPGTIWVRQDGVFNFHYRFEQSVLERYIRFEPDRPSTGLFMDFVNGYKEDFVKVFDVVHLAPPFPIPFGAALDRYAVWKGKTAINENVLVAQRAYLESAWLGKGANAQENCYIIHSRLEGENVTAHGGKVIRTRLGKRVFVGFNAFLRGKKECPLTIGEETIVMPHTIIDLDEPLTIPPRHLVWGFIRSGDDLKTHSISFDRLSSVKSGLALGTMLFEGNGARFVETFQHRIEHILEANGAFFDGVKNRGHAQRNQLISFNTIQPYPEGDLEGLYPTIEIRP
jgi:carbonic anhydrase/acetyltransferase-like protein (isoleucine patch superfamily)